MNWENLLLIKNISMPKVTPLNFREVSKKLKAVWYKWPIPWWKHMHMYNGTQVIPVPSHWWKDVSQGVILSIINQIWISVIERNNL